MFGFSAMTANYQQPLRLNKDASEYKIAQTELGYPSSLASTFYLSPLHVTTRLENDLSSSSDPIDLRCQQALNGLMDQTKEQDEDYGYNLFPERKKSKYKKGSIGESLFTFNHKCQVMLQFAMETSPYAKLLLGAMKNSGCTAYKDRHFSCEDCDGTVSGGFDATTSQIVLCQNNIHQQAHMNRVVTHELVHAFDHCRAHVDWFNNFKHLACSEIRAANLSGECAFTNEVFRLNFGINQHHQECVRGRALRSILAVRKISREEAEKVVDEVFDSCFHDHAPFGRIPHGKKDAKFAYRDFEGRDRYYANL